MDARHGNFTIKADNPVIQSNKIDELLISNFIIVLSSQSMVIRWIFRQQSLAHNPIGVLILVDEIEKLLGFIVLTLYQFLFDNPTVKHLAHPGGHPTLCIGKTVSAFFVTSLSFGGLGISLMRFLYQLL